MSKYKIGDHVIYGASGSCEIVEIGTLSFAGPEKVYYSLKPIYDARSTIYVPVAKEDEIKRKVIVKKEAKDILDAVKDVKPAKYVASKEICDPIIKSGDNIEIAKLIKLLRNMRKENRKAHKGLNILEERLLRDAERVFFSEIATAFNMTIEEVVSNYSVNLD